MAGLQVVALEQRDRSMIGRSSLGHDTEHFALKRADIFDIRARVKRKRICRNARRNADEVCAAKDRVYYGASRAADVDVSRNQRLGQPGAAGYIDVLKLETVLLIELCFGDQPQGQHRAARLRVTHANAERSACCRRGERKLHYQEAND